MNSPIQLQASVSLGNGIVAEVEQTRMQNPFRTAMLVDEFRFHAIVTAGAEDADPSFNYQASIFLGREPLTHGFVPVGLLSSMKQDLVENNSTVGELSYGLTSWTWKLPKPMYVPPTEQIIMKLANFPNAGISLTTAYTMVVGVSGRSLAADHPVPSVIHLPWAASYLTPDTVDSGEMNTFVSGETDLVNPFNQPLLIHRFIGRGVSSGPDIGGGGFDAAQALRTTVIAADSFGTIMVRDPAPFTNIFFFGTNAWNVNCVLPPKGFYKFQLTQDYSQLALVNRDDNCLGISMIGSREVRLR